MAGNYPTLAQASISSSRASGPDAYAAESKPALVPYDGQAQQALLGSILLAGGILPDVMAVLSGRSEAFWGQTDSLIYAAMLAVYQADKPLDGITLTHELKSGGNSGAHSGAVWQYGWAAAALHGRWCTARSESFCRLLRR